MPDEKGRYTYTNPNRAANYSSRPVSKNKTVFSLNRGFVSFEFSHQFGVIKTRTGYANGIAMDIENHASSVVLGTIADNNTILIIPREGVSRQEIFNRLAAIVPGMKNEQ